MNTDEKKQEQLTFDIVPETKVKSSCGKVVSQLSMF